MALALYRKYRPRTFAEVIGQEHVTEPLSQALRSGRLHHAYLFSGPRGCGKTSSARILARSLNCEQGPTPEPCGVCASCRSLANDAAGSIDVIEIDAASHGGVDDARDLREKAFFAPASSRYKIYVIDEAHMVSPAGFNALLKLVEEPPDYVKFIFATTEPEKVLGTIKSRTHHYPFRLIAPAVLRPYLQQLADAEGIHVEPAVFPLVVRAGGGSARDTLSVLDQLIAGAGPDGVTYARAVSLLGVTDVTLIDEMCDALAAGDGAAAFAAIDRVAEAGHDPRRFASDLLERFRDLIVLQQVPDAVAKGLIDGPTDQLDAMSAQATRLGPATLSRCADIVHNGLVEMRGTTAPRLLLELLTARMLLPGADDSAGALLQRLERMERRLTLSGDGAPSAISTGTGDDQAPASTGDGSVGGGGRSAARAAAVAAGRRAPSDTAGDGSATGATPGPASVAHGDRSGGARESERSADRADSGPTSERPDGRADGGWASARPDGVRASEGSKDRADGGRASEGSKDRADGGRASEGSDVAAEKDEDDRPAAASGRRGEPVGVLPDPPEEPSDVEPRTPGRLSAAAIREVWPEIITTLGRKSKRIAALASGATVRDLDGETVVLTFRFPVHAEMVAAESDTITDALYEALGGRWLIRCEVSGEAGGTGGATRSPAAVAPARPPTQKTASRQATAAVTRQREVVTPSGGTEGDAGTEGDDDWPEPARPGGLPQSADPAPGRSGGPARAADPAPAVNDAGVGGDADRTAQPIAPVTSPAAQRTPPLGATGQPAGVERVVATRSPQRPSAERAPAEPPSRGLAAARAAAAAAGGGATRGEAAATAVGTRNGTARAEAGSAAARVEAGTEATGVRGGARTDAGSAARAGGGSSAWPDGSPAEEPPWDPEYDGPPPSGIAAYEGFDPGDEPLDEVLDEKTARETSEQQAMRLLQDAFGAEKIGEV